MQWRGGRMTERTMPGGSGNERSLLDAWLDYYRATLLAKCEGLTGDQLVARSCEPSPMSLIGLVRHMTEMERVYGHRLADCGISWLYCTDENEAGDFEAVTAPGAAADLDTFRAHCVRTRQIMAAHQLGDTPQTLPPRRGHVSACGGTIAIRMVHTRIITGRAANGRKTGVLSQRPLTVIRQQIR